MAEQRDQGASDPPERNPFREWVERYKITTLYSKTRQSFVWRHFGHVSLVTEGKQKTLCSDYFCDVCLCKAKATDSAKRFEECRIKRYASTISTTNMQRHLFDVHKIQGDAQAKDTTVNDFFQSLPKRKEASARKNNLARDIVLWIARDLLPFNIVHEEGLQDFLLKYGVIKSAEDLPDRTTLSRSALTDIYRGMHEEVRRRLKDCSRFCAVTYDLWTDNFRRRSYITFTCHTLTDNFELQSCTLCTRHMEGRHTGAAIMNEYVKCLEEFDLTAKTVHAVTDAGSNMKRAVTLSCTEHHLCTGHALHNLVLNDGFASVPELHSLLVKCRAAVKCVHYRASELEDIVDGELNVALLSLVRTGDILEHDENDPVAFESEDHAYSSASMPQNVTLKLDTPTRWHSILSMFESLLANRAALRKLLPRLGQPFPSPDEWSLISELHDFLKQFKCAVELLSQERSCTFNVLAVIRSELLESFEENVSDSPMLKELKKAMLRKFDYRFPLNDAVVAASLLDPRFQNLKIVDEYLKNRCVSKLQFLVEQVLCHVRENDVKKGHNDIVPPGNVLLTLAKRHSACEQQWSNEIHAECHSLLSKPCAQVGDLLGFWKSNQNELPWLTCLAKKLLCVPATSTPSERVFSIAGLVVRSRRASLHPLTVDRLIFVHDNYQLCKAPHPPCY